MRHFAHHIGDYAAATAHLSFVEDAAYHRLLRLYYRDERPLPTEVSGCQRVVGARTKDERAAVETVLREFFTLEADGWHQARADDEIAGYQERADKARENGQLGGRPKTKRKPKGKPTNNRDGYLSDTQTEPNEKLTNNQEPVTNNQDVANATSPEPRSAPDEQRIKLPSDWQPTTDDRDHASDKGLDPDSTTPAFCDYFHEGRGRNEKRTLAGWSKRYRIWCTTDAERRPPGRAGVRPTRGGGDTAAFARAAMRLGGDEPVR